MRKRPWSAGRHSGLWRTLIFAVLFSQAVSAFAGGPRLTAGKSYFDPAAKGIPLHWTQGTLSYYLDQGALSPTVDHATAAAIVADAAAQWSGVATAAVSIVEAGALDEDVNGVNVTSTPGDVPSGWTQAPSDIAPTGTGKPLAIILDADGSVLDALLGNGVNNGASDPLACADNAVTVRMDTIATDGTFQHAFMLLNGRCTDTLQRMETLKQAVLRGFGQVLGLDWSQANDEVFAGNAVNFTASLAGWPVMHPIEPMCGNTGLPCILRGMRLRPDDIASLSRLYPVTAGNAANYPGKTLTASSTVSIQGTVRFPSGQGMQGVNVVAYPVVPGTTQPDRRYPVSAVTGEYFQGNQGNPVTGWIGNDGHRFDEFGDDNAELDGFFDLSAMPLPPGQSQSDYVLTFEAVNALYVRQWSVGAQTLGVAIPSGTLPNLLIRNLSRGANAQQNIVIPGAAAETRSGNDGSEGSPAPVPGSGEWGGRLTGYGHAGWFAMRIRGNRSFTVEAQALDEHGQSTVRKARVVLGVWDAIDGTGSPSVVNSGVALNSMTGGEFLNVTTTADGQIRIGVADDRGDGRPDYVYRGRVLYADTVTPSHMGANGGTITIRGMGFRPGNNVVVAGVAAAITSLSSTEITALAAAPPSATTGQVVVEVNDPSTGGSAQIDDGLSFDAGVHDDLALISGPQDVIAMGVPIPFVVRAVDQDWKPAPGVSVKFNVDYGPGVLGCGSTVCTVVAASDGLAQMGVAATAAGEVSVTASLSSGAFLKREFTGGTPPSIAALNSHLYLARGAISAWQPQALILNSGVAAAGQAVTWTAGAGVVTQTSASVSDAGGVATGQVLAGPLAESVDVSIRACMNGGASCDTFTVSSVHPEYAGLVEVSGAGQTMLVSDTPAPIVLEAVIADGHPMAGAVVSVYQVLSAWTPACGPHDRCRVAPILARLTTTAVSGPDGVVSITPLSLAGVATTLSVIAATGLQAELDFVIERHP